MSEDLSWDDLIDAVTELPWFPYAALTCATALLILPSVSIPLPTMPPAGDGSNTLISWLLQPVLHSTWLTRSLFCSLHLIAACLFMRLTRNALKFSPPASLLAALLYLLHPLNLLPVYFVFDPGRLLAFCAVFGCAELALSGRLIAALLLAALGAAASPVGLLAVPLLLILRFRDRVPSPLTLAVPALLLIIAAGMTLFSLSGISASTSLGIRSPAYNMLGIIFRACKVVQDSLFPFQTALIFGGGGMARFFLYCAASLAFLAWGWGCLLRAKTKEAPALMLWFLLCLLATASASFAGTGYAALTELTSYGAAGGMIWIAFAVGRQMLSRMNVKPSSAFVLGAAISLAAIFLMQGTRTQLRLAAKQTAFGERLSTLYPTRKFRNDYAELQLRSEEYLEAIYTLGNAKRTGKATAAEAARTLMIEGNFAFNFGKYAGSLPYFAAALKADPAQTEAAIKLSICYEKLGRKEKALTVLDTAIGRHPRNAELAHRKAAVLLASGRIAEGYAEMDRSARLAAASF